MHRRVADAPPFSDLPFSGLELGLGENDDLGALRHERPHGFENLRRRDEGEIHHGQIGEIVPGCPGEFFAGEIACVHALKKDDPGVAPELPVELALAHVHAGGAARPPLEQTVGEAPRRCAHVQAEPSLGRDPEGVQRRLELEAAPADVGAGIFLDGDMGIGGKSCARLVGQRAVHGDEAGEDEFLRPLSARGETPLEEELVQPLSPRHAR